MNSILFNAFVGFKYLLARKKNVFLQRIIITSLFVVVISVGIPILVIAVINGLHDSIEVKILGTNFPLRITSKFRGINNYDELCEEIKGMQGVKYALPYRHEDGLIESPSGLQHFVEVYGYRENDLESYDDFYRIVKISQPVRKSIDDLNDRPDDDGEKHFLLSDPQSAYLGEALASRMGIHFISRNPRIVKLMIPSVESVDFSSDKAESIYIKDRFTAGYASVDETRVILPFKAFSSVFKFNDFATGIGITVKDGFDPSWVMKSIKKTFGERYPEFIYYDTAKEEALFKDFRRERLLLNIVLVIVMLAAFLTIYITLHVIVIEKRKEIGILKAVGATSSQIVYIYTFIGFFIGLAGGILGLMIGIASSLGLSEMIHGLEFVINFVKDNVLSVDFLYDWFSKILPYEVLNNKWVLIPEDVFYLNTLPYKIRVMDLFFQFFGALLVSTLGAFLPALKTVKEQPAIIIRGYE